MKRVLVIIIFLFLLVSCGRVSGTYVNEEPGLVEQIEFTGNKTCIVTYFGLELPATYRIDNGHIYADAGEGLLLLFKVQDPNTLEGEGTWNKGTFKKVK